MEGLQPLITHRFWVCFAVSVLLIPIGWWMGSSSLAKEIETKRGEIEAAESGIPKGADHPNPDWIGGLKVVVAKRKDYHVQHGVELWEMQRSVMTWPASIKSAFEGVKFFGPGTNEDARSTYRSAYYEDLERIYKIVDPIGVIGTQDNPIYLGIDSDTGKVTDGKVLFDFAVMPKAVHEPLWGRQGSRNPEWKEMWEAQQDLWLTEALLKSIKRVNDHRGTKNIYDASVRQIVTLMLRGGSRGTDAAAAAGGATGEMPGTGAGGLQTPGGSPSSYGGGIGGIGGIGGKSPMGGAEGGAAGAAGGPLAITFLDDAFGKEVPRESAATSGGAAAGTEGPAPMSGATGATPLKGGTMGGGIGGIGGMGGSSANANMSPYVDNDPEMPFKTRGFVLQVLMNRKDLPLLVQELTNAKESRFPVEILRIHEIDRDIDHTGLEIRSRLGTGGGFEGGDGGVPGIGGLGTPGFGGAGGLAPMGPMRGPGGAGGIGLGGLGGGATPPTGARPFGRGPMGSFPGGEGGGIGAMSQQNASYAVALKDSGLGYVAIAGLMTIYQPPKTEPKNVDANSAVPKQPEPKAGAKDGPGATPKSTTTTSGQKPKSSAKSEPKPSTGAGSKPSVTPGKPAGKDPKTPVPKPSAPKGKPSAIKAGTPGGKSVPDPKSSPPVGAQPSGKT